MDHRLRAQLAEVLHEVVDERVVVVDDEDRGGHRHNGTQGRARAIIDFPRTTLVAVPVSKSKRSRYTPPPPKKAPPSPLWVPVSLCVLMLTGLVVVLANYLQALPGNTENRYLILGLVLITSGFGLATTYR